MRSSAGPLALALSVAFGCGAGPEAGARLDAATLWGAVAAPEDALTFARRLVPAGRELLLVSAVEGERVVAVVVPGAHDPIAALEREGADALRARARSGVRSSVPLGELGLPLDLGERHIAAGTNFRAHGEEVGVEEPFLFPNLWRGSLYLQPGDEVVARATGLGALRNRVAAAR